MTASKGSSPLISVIIPVYNVEPYLRECLDSVLNQTLRDIEIICINDCSTDGSLAVLNDYASKDERIKVIDKRINEGLSQTRNVGIAAASGKYMLFVDSDDFVDLNLCRKALDCAETNQAELVIYDFVPFRNAEELNANRKRVSTVATLDASDRASFLKIYAFAWTKMIRSDLVHLLNLKFPVGLTYEDTPVHWQLVTLAKKIAIMPERLCFYRQRSSSISYRTDWTLADKIDIYDSIRHFLVSHNLYESYRDVFLQSQLEVFSLTYETIDESHKNRLMALIQNRLRNEHWIYVDSPKPLHWRTRDFYHALRGSYLAKARRSLWFLARDCYRSLKRKGSILSLNHPAYH